MNQVNKFPLNRLHQQESFEFHRQVYEIVKLLIDLGVIKLVMLYYLAIGAFDIALKQLRESIDTIEVTRLDNARDRAWRGLKAGIKALLNHYDETIVRNAHILDVVIRNYGDPTRLSYNEETSVIFNLCQELEKTEYLGLLNQLHLTFWYEDMRRFNQEFKRLFTSRGSEQDMLISGLAQEKRRETDDAYRNLVNYINSLAFIDDSEELKTAIRQVNYYVKYYSDMLAARQGRAKAKKEKNKEDGENE